MSRVVVTTQTIAAVGDCCCEPGACTICGEPNPLITEPIFITVTSATGDMATVWFSATGYVTLPHTFALTDVNLIGCSFSDLSVEVCGGIVTVMSLGVSCKDNAICMNALFGLSRDVTCVVEVPAINGSDCDGSGTITFTMDAVVCDVDGFVAQDFTANCGAYGSFSGTIHI